MRGPPTGTVTFLFTDVEGSTRLWEGAPRAMAAALQRHDEILRRVLFDEGGHVFSVAGDSFGAAFQDHRRAVTAARRIQQALADEAWPPGAAITVRMGLHVGSSDDERAGNYFGTAVNTAARVMSAAHGGEVLLSDALRTVIDEPAILIGPHRAKGLTKPLQLWRLVLDGDTTVAAPLRSDGADRDNLPADAPRLFGREADLTRVSSALDVHRLVTLAGPGGIGKTALATAASRSAVGRRDGVRLAELAAVSPGLLAQQVADAIGAVARPGRTMDESILAFLAEREMLLVLDNGEHLLDAVAPLVGSLLRACPGVTVLATSREPLEVRGEYVLRLEGLDTTGPTAAAVDLFFARADAAGSAPRDDEASRSLVARLCARLDGMPLAIELAAARSRSADLVELDRRLERAVRLSRPGRHDVDRHRTTDATIAWSHDLLDDDERRLFRRLAVFVESFDLAAAEEVGASDGLSPDEVFDVADSLVVKSLVVRRGDGRLRLLEPMRWYARERLAEAGEVESARERHLRHFSARADRCYRDVPMRGDADLLRLLDADRANLIAAAEWAIERGDVDAGLPIVLAARIGAYQMRWEFHDLAARLVELPGAAAHERVVEALILATIVAIERGHTEEQARLTARLWAGRRSAAANAHLALAIASHHAIVIGDPTSVEAFERLDTSDHWVRCMYYFIGAWWHRHADRDAGQRRLEEGVAWARAIVARGYLPLILLQLAEGEVRYPERDPARGLAYAEEAEAAALVAGLPHVRIHARILPVLALHRLSSSVDKAAAELAGALREAIDAGSILCQWPALRAAAVELARRGHGIDAALVEACSALHPLAWQDLDLVLPLAVSEHDRTAAAEIASTITSTEQLSRRILAVLESIAEP